MGRLQLPDSKPLRAAPSAVHPVPGRVQRGELPSILHQSTPLSAACSMAAMGASVEAHVQMLGCPLVLGSGRRYPPPPVLWASHCM
jgi:hypothetical protein